jgi:hypothetical protein
MAIDRVRTLTGRNRGVSLQRMGDATAWLGLLGQREAEEGALPWMSHGALLRVEPKSETPFDEACDAAITRRPTTAHTDKAPLPLDFRASRASGSVVEACVSFERFSLRKLRSPLRPGVGGSSWPSLRRKLFMLAHAWISVPSTGKCSSDSSALD